MGRGSIDGSGLVLRSGGGEVEEEGVRQIPKNMSQIPVGLNCTVLVDSLIISAYSLSQTIMYFYNKDSKYGWSKTE